MSFLSCPQIDYLESLGIPPRSVENMASINKAVRRRPLQPPIPACPLPFLLPLGTTVAVCAGRIPHLQ